MEFEVISWPQFNYNLLISHSIVLLALHKLQIFIFGGDPPVQLPLNEELNAFFSEELFKVIFMPFPQYESFSISY